MRGPRTGAEHETCGKNPQSATATAALSGARHETDRAPRCETADEHSEHDKARIVLLSEAGKNMKHQRTMDLPREAAVKNPPRCLCMGREFRAIVVKTC